jgi:hypothetical protein
LLREVCFTFVSLLTQSWDDPFDIWILQAYITCLYIYTSSCPIPEIHCIFTRDLPTYAMSHKCQLVTDGHVINDYSFFLYLPIMVTIEMVTFRCTRHEGTHREWSTAPVILNLGTRCRWVVSLTPRPLYPRTNSPQ